MSSVAIDRKAATASRKMAKPHYVPHIDGLRAIAVCSVIAYHLHAGLLPGGFTGVDIFFVISGFVVSTSVGSLAGMPFRAFLAHFYARRLFRIAPALIACLIITTAAFVLLVPASWLSETNQKTGLYAFIGLSNFILARSDNDYFSPRVDFNPFTHTWSLGVEEQFYLIFPWLFLPWLKARRKLAACGMAFALAVSLLWAWHLGRVDPGRSFYMITSRFWELAAGVLLFQVGTLPRSQPLKLPQPLLTCGLWASLAIIVYGLAAVAPSTTPFPGGLWPAAGTVGLLWLLPLTSSQNPLRRVLEAPAVRFVGKISYSLYLWHWPVFVLFRWTCGLDSLLPQSCALVLAIGFAIASYDMVETPLRGVLPRWRVPRPIPILAGLAAIGVGYGIANTLWALQPHISFSTVTQHADEWYPNHAVSQPSNGCHISQTLFPVGGSKATHYMQTGCTAPKLLNKQIFVIGDSHAFAYTSMLEMTVRDDGADVFLYSAAGCSFTSLIYDTTPSCAAFDTAFVRDVLTKLHPGDIIFLPALRMPRLAEQFTFFGMKAAMQQVYGPGAIASQKRNEDNARPILQQMSDHGAMIVLEDPTPVFYTVPFRCADWYDRDNPICEGPPTVPRAAIETLRAPVLQAFTRFQAEIPNIHTWDPTAKLCPGSVCSEYRNGKPLFFDGDHLSGYSNRLLQPDFVTFLRTLESAKRG